MTEAELAAIEARAAAATRTVAWDVTRAPLRPFVTEDVPALVAEVRRLREALQAQPAAEGHMAGIFCPAFHGQACGCGHSVIATALGRDETPI